MMLSRNLGQFQVIIKNILYNGFAKKVHSRLSIYRVVNLFLKLIIALIEIPNGFVGIMVS